MRNKFSEFKKLLKISSLEDQIMEIDEKLEWSD